MPRVIIGTLGEAAFIRHADALYRLRSNVFHERLHWKVSCLAGREIDEYDDADAVYVAALDEADDVVGGWRLRPTLMPYMLDEVFPWLLHGAAAPRDAGIWEASRFVVARYERKRCGLGFNETARLLFRATARYALERGIREYVMVLSTGVLRLVRHSSLRVRTYGPAVDIDGVTSVACRIAVDTHTREVLGSPGSPAAAPAGPKSSRGLESRRNISSR